MSSVTDILQPYGFPDQEKVYDLGVKVAQNIQTNLLRIKQKIINGLQMRQMDLIRSNKKLLFYSSFKTTQSISIQLDFVKKYTTQTSCCEIEIWKS